MRCSVSRSLLSIVLVSAASGAALAATYYPRTFDPNQGGSVCYQRSYTDAVRRRNPGLKLTAISVERRSSVSDVKPNSKKLFGVTFGATTKAENYVANADCRHQGSVISCCVESDGGNFTITRSGNGVIIRTHHVSIEGIFNELDISSKKRGPIRSFTLRGHGNKACDAVFD